MHISQIQLRQFRNYTDRRFEFDSGVTVITGINGIGKTNIIEALYVLATGSSFRDTDALLATHGTSEWKISAICDAQQREVKYSSKKSYTINDLSYQRLSHNHILPVVLFEPDDLMLIHGSPKSRRAYLDKQIAKITPGYSNLLRRYDRVVAQRNKLLKQPILDNDSLFVWDISLAELATKIVDIRQNYIDGWNNQLTGYYQRIAATDDNIMVSYKSSVSRESYTQSIIARLRESVERDRLLGSTGVGPHRDDYIFYINNHDMTHVASRGEVRTLLLSLVLYEVEQLTKYYQTPPLLLLDDVMSELDTTRQNNIIDSHTGQIVITSTTYLSDRSVQHIALL